VSRWVLGLGLVAACGGATVDHEDLGDAHYREGRYAEALAEYLTIQRSTPTPARWAKAGAAALHADDLQAAIEAFRELGRTDPTRQQEAARGLERVVRAAAHRAEGGRGVVASAVMSMRQVAPDRPLPRIALAATDVDALEQEEAVRILPGAIGAADRSGDVDRLLARYGQALEQTTACDAAAEVYGTVLRRTPGGRARTTARAGLAACALRLGLDALEADLVPASEDWLITSLVADSTGPIGLRARVALGDARLRQGDVLGAAIWWQSVLSAGTVPDSVRRLAAERLNNLSSGDPQPPGAEA